MRRAGLQVTNGFDAAYNFVRHTLPIDLTDAALSDVVESMLVVRPSFWWLS